MKTIAVIPARYASTRLPGKPLVDLAGKTMICRVYERASEAIDTVIVATDDTRIADEVKGFGGEVFMTDPNHNTGTNRCLEAYQKWAAQNEEQADVVLNIQGDEPLLDPESLKTLVAPFARRECDMATLVTPLRGTDAGASQVYAVLDAHNRALYFSRYPIPYIREAETNTGDITRYRHLGIYAFRPGALAEFAAMKQGMLEQAESLEQLRWLEAGRAIYCGIVDESSISVDTPEDVEHVRQLLKSAV